MDKALLIDLDGTIITTASGRKFPVHSADWKFIPITLEVIKHYYTKDFKIIIVSNQGGIEQGYLAERVFIRKIEDICKNLEKRLKIKTNDISYIYCNKMVSYNRKPNPGMAYELALEYELNLKESVMIGDYKTDEQFAINAGIGTYLDVDELTEISWK